MTDERLEDAPSEGVNAARHRWLRLGALAVISLGLLLTAHLTGLTAEFKPAAFRVHMANAGWWGPLVFLTAFAVGELVHVPGVVFVGAAVVAYGRPLGGALAFVGAILSLTVAFAVVRGIGGKPLGAIRWAFVRRLLSHLDEHPVRTIFLLRSVLWMTPQLNYVLALSNVRFRSYVFASAVGLVVPVAILSFIFEWLLG